MILFTLLIILLILINHNQFLILRLLYSKYYFYILYQTYIIYNIILIQILPNFNYIKIILFYNTITLHYNNHNVHPCFIFIHKGSFIIIFLWKILKLYNFVFYISIINWCIFTTFIMIYHNTVKINLYSSCQLTYY